MRAPDVSSRLVDAAKCPSIDSGNVPKFDAARRNAAANSSRNTDISKNIDEVLLTANESNGDFRAIIFDANDAIFNRYRGIDTKLSTHVTQPWTAQYLAATSAPLPRHFNNYNSSATLY
jgi:hypothetical protein